MDLPELYHPRQHLKPLDGVRGLAILMVMMLHAFQSNYEGHRGLAYFVGTVFQYGIFGVDLFFVLSGFLITGILVDSLGDEGFFQKFYARRALRIFPLYYGMLCVLFVLTPALHLHWRGMGWLLLGYLQNLRPETILHFSPGANISLNHLWSLAIEEQFYLVWPAVVFLVRGRKRLMITAIALSVSSLLLRVVLIFHGVSAELIHATTITRADSLLIGGVFALLFRSPRWAQVQRLAPAAALAAWGVVLGSILLIGPEMLRHKPLSLADQLWIHGVRYTVLALGSAAIIVWSIQAGSICEWIFMRRWLRFLGKYSYGIYVIHMILLSQLLGPQREWIAMATHSKMIGVIGAAVSSLAVSIVLAYLSFHLYEMPFLRLKRLFVYGEGRRMRAASPEELSIPASLPVKMAS